MIGTHDGPTSVWHSSKAPRYWWYVESTDTISISRTLRLRFEEGGNSLGVQVTVAERNVRRLWAHSVSSIFCAVISERISSGFTTVPFLSSLLSDRVSIRTTEICHLAGGLVAGVTASKPSLWIPGSILSMTLVLNSLSNCPASL